MAETRTYTIGKSRIKKAFLQGIACTETGQIRVTEGEKHILFLTKLNSMEVDCVWGCLHVDFVPGEECLCIVRAFASNNKEMGQGQEIDAFLTTEDIDIVEKKAFLQRMGCFTVINQQDILLYELTGQYLWISVEVAGKAEGTIEHLHVLNPGDNFMQTFPDIYQDAGSFFHRYMSIFSTMYNHLGNTIAQIGRLFDFDEAPPGLLYLYAEWLGLDVHGEFLEVNILRKLLQETYTLNRIRGTREALLRLIDIVLGEEAIIVERILLEGYITKEDRRMYNTLYGSSEQDITILIPCKAEEKLQARLEFLLKQFKPMRSRLKLVCFGECNQMDYYCYMDNNARLYTMPEGSLDLGREFNASIIRN